MYMAVVVLLTSSGIKQVPACPSVLLLPFTTSTTRKFQFTELDSAINRLIYSIRSSHIKLHIRSYNFACLHLTLCSDSHCDAKLRGIASGTRYVCHMRITSTMKRYAIPHTNTPTPNMCTVIKFKTQWTGGWLCAIMRMAQLDTEIRNLFERLPSDSNGLPTAVSDVTRTMGNSSIDRTSDALAKFCEKRFTSFVVSAPIVRNFAKFLKCSF